MAAKKHRWIIWGLDVWGTDDEEGYQVNDRWRSGFCYLPANPTDKQVIHGLRLGLGYTGAQMPFKNFVVDGDDIFLSVDRKRDGKPIYQLEKEE